MLNSSQQSGVSLLEVLIAIVVFSLGLMGLLSAAALTIRTNQDAYSATQVVNVAEYLFGAMRRNPLGVAALSYNNIYIATPFIAANAPTTCQAASCTPVQIAAADIQRVQLLMGQYLPPGARITILCVAPTVIPIIASQVFRAKSAIPPYNQTCTITQRWSVDRIGTQETRTWIFQP